MREICVNIYIYFRLIGKCDICAQYTTFNAVLLLYFSSAIHFIRGEISKHMIHAPVIHHTTSFFVSPLSVYIKVNGSCSSSISCSLGHIFGPKCFIVSLSGIGSFLLAGASAYIMSFGKSLKSSACLTKNVRTSVTCFSRSLPPPSRDK